MKFLVRDIYEEDFGCEGRPDGYEPVCVMKLQGDDGKELEIKASDAELTEKKIEAGDWVVFDAQSKICKYEIER